MSDFKYEKPQAHTLGALSAAEGLCAPGTGASRGACTPGSVAGICSAGTTAIENRVDALCFPGGFAANCITGTDAG